jgi:hypothetical protein
MGNDTADPPVKYALVRKSLGLCALADTAAVSVRIRQNSPHFIVVTYVCNSTVPRDLGSNAYSMRTSVVRLNVHLVVRRRCAVNMSLQHVAAWRCNTGTTRVVVRPEEANVRVKKDRDEKTD